MQSTVTQPADELRVLRGSTWALLNPPPHDVIGLTTVDDTLAVLEEIVRGKERVEAAPIYIDSELHCPICLIAVLLAAQGLDVEWLRRWELESERTDARELAADLGLTRAVGEVLQAAQSAQDEDGGNWAGGLAAARVRAESLTLQAV